MLNSNELASYFNCRNDEAASLLAEMISFRSTAGREREIQAFLFDHLKHMGLEPRYAPVDEAITSDPDYTRVPDHQGYAGRTNLVIDIPGTGGGRSVILCSHVDVVPGPEESFTAERVGDIVRGRGTCDAKGQVVTIILVLKALADFGIRLKGALEAQLVIEEEVGGNGALSCILEGRRADAAIIMEPTGLEVHPANRGALWYSLAVKGRSVHMGKYWEGVSALDQMIELVGVLRKYEAKLRQESCGNPLFPDDPSPVVVNIGQISGGDWPSTVPAECRIEGGIAFLPNKRISGIRDEVREAIEAGAGEWAKRNYSLEFTRLHNDAFETPIDHPAVKSLCAVADSVRGARPPSGWIASCDARLYYHRGQMPTIVFGPGDLQYAHAVDEQIDVSEITRAAEIVTRFVIDWSG